MRIDKRILQLALPAILSNITVPLLGLSDTAIAGHLGDPLFLASMAVGASMIHLSFWLFGFLRMGTTGLTARAFGRKDTRALSDLFCRSLFWGVMIGIWLIAFSGPLSELILNLLKPGSEVQTQAELYYRYCILAAPAQLGVMAMAGWMVGMQSTFWPMVVALSTNIINIPVSLLLVFGFEKGFAGLAVGTCIAQWCGAFMALLFCVRLWRRYQATAVADSVAGSLGKSLSGVGRFVETENGRISLASGFLNLFKVSGEGSFFSVNLYLFFRSAAVMGVLMGMTAFAGRAGEMALAVNAVIIQFFYFFSYFMDGFAYAAEALTGKMAGSRDTAGLKDVVSQSLGWSGVMVVLFTLVYTLFGQGIVSLLTDSAEVGRGVMEMNWVLLSLPLLSVGAFIYDGFFIGLSKTGWMLIASVVGAAVFYIVNIFGLTPSHSAFPSTDGSPAGNTLVWIGFLAYLLVRGGMLAIVLKTLMLHPLDRQTIG